MTYKMAGKQTQSLKPLKTGEQVTPFQIAGATPYQMAGTMMGTKNCFKLPTEVRMKNSKKADKLNLSKKTSPNISNPKK